MNVAEKKVNWRNEWQKMQKREKKWSFNFNFRSRISFLVSIFSSAIANIYGTNI